MSLHGIRALTFDVVGTLIDFETGILRGVRAVAPEGAHVRGAHLIPAARVSPACGSMTRNAPVAATRS